MYLTFQCLPKYVCLTLFFSVHLLSVKKSAGPCTHRGRSSETYTHSLCFGLGSWEGGGGSSRPWPVEGRVLLRAEFISLATRPGLTAGPHSTKPGMRVTRVGKD